MAKMMIQKAEIFPSKAPFAPAKKDRGSALDIKGFRADMTQGVARRCADYLDWAAKKFPGQFTAYPLIAKAVFGGSRMPRMDNDQVQSIARNSNSIRQQLYKHYAREMVTESGVGIRATTDDADVLTHVLTRRVRRLDSAKRGVEKTASMIDLKNVPDTPDMKALKSWYRNDVVAIVKTITAPDFEDRLLPPIPHEEG